MSLTTADSNAACQKIRAAGLLPQASPVPGSGTAEPSPLAETCGKGGTIRQKQQRIKITSRSKIRNEECEIARLTLIQAITSAIFPGSLGARGGGRRGPWGVVGRVLVGQG